VGLAPQRAEAALEDPRPAHAGPRAGQDIAQCWRGRRRREACDRQLARKSWWQFLGEESLQPDNPRIQFVQADFFDREGTQVTTWTRHKEQAGLARVTEGCPGRECEQEPPRPGGAIGLDINAEEQGLAALDAVCGGRFSQADRANGSERGYHWQTPIRS
jgi:hypothetical protein